MTDSLQDTRQHFRLRRHGEAPLRFVGWMLQAQLGVPSIVVSPACLWHELGLYQTIEGLFVVEIVAWSKDGAGLARRVRCHALAFEALDDAVGAIECHDPTADICASVLVAAFAGQAPGCDWISQSRYSQVRARFSGTVEARFRALAGALLYQIALISARATAHRAHPSHPRLAQLSPR